MDLCTGRRALAAIDNANENSEACGGGRRGRWAQGAGKRQRENECVFLNKFFYTSYV